VRHDLRREATERFENDQALLADRVECTPVLVVGARGYAFTGDGTFGGLLAPALGPLPSVAPTAFEPVFGHGHVFASSLT
jgi:hypothetical protein